MKHGEEEVVPAAEADPIATQDNTENAAEAFEHDGGGMDDLGASR